MAKNQDEDVLVEETEDIGTEPRVYELGFHLDPELPIEEVKKAYQAMRSSTLSSSRSSPGRRRVRTNASPRRLSWLSSRPTVW